MMNKNAPNVWSVFYVCIHIHMKTIIPQNDMLLCTIVSSNEKETSTGFVYKSNDLTLYQVKSIGPSVSYDNIRSGDIVIANSTGSKVTLNGIEYCLLKEENIMGKVV